MSSGPRNILVPFRANNAATLIALGAGANRLAASFEFVFASAKDAAPREHRAPAFLILSIGDRAGSWSGIPGGRLLGGIGETDESWFLEELLRLHARDRYAKRESSELERRNLKDLAGVQPALFSKVPRSGDRVANDLLRRMSRPNLCLVWHRLRLAR